MRTIVLQSFRTHDVPEWLAACMASVRQWAAGRGWDYQFSDDRFFDFAPAWAKARCGDNVYAVTDVCRLVWLSRQLDAGYERVVWADADILVFAPQRLSLAAPAGYAFAHELFLSVGPDASFTPIEGVNNALMVFERAGAPMLARYLEAALAELADAPPGPIARTALLPLQLARMRAEGTLAVIHGVGLFTLALMREIADGGGRLTRECVQRSPAPLAAANLCHFLRNAAAPEQRPVFDRIYLRAVERLLATRGGVLAGAAASPPA